MVIVFWDCDFMKGDWKILEVYRVCVCVHFFRIIGRLSSSTPRRRNIDDIHQLPKWLEISRAMLCKDPLGLPNWSEVIQDDPRLP